MIEFREGLHTPSAVMTGALMESRGARHGSEFTDVLGRRGVPLSKAVGIDERLDRSSKGRVIDRIETAGDPDDTDGQVITQVRDFYVGLSLVSRKVSNQFPDRVFYHVRSITPEEAGLFRTPISCRFICSQPISPPLESLDQNFIMSSE